MFPEIIIKIAETIKRENGRMLIVGGAVRDMLLNIPPKDIDIEIYGLEVEKIEELIQSLNPEQLDVAGRSFCVFKTKINDLELDISIPRRDSKISEGHKGFEIKGDPYMAPEEAARRRDITINALAYDPLKDEVLDFFHGQEDLEDGIIRAVDFTKFGEDPLRVLRVIQFAARFNFQIEGATQDLCRQIVQTKEFKNQPSIRIGEEWKKLLLKSPQPSIGLEVGLRLGAWQVLHPELVALVDVEQEKDWHPEGDVWTHSLMAVDEAAKIVKRENLNEEDALVIILASLSHDFGKPYTTKIEEKDDKLHSYGHQKAGVEPTLNFLKRLSIEEDIQKQIAILVKEHMFLALNKEPTDKAIKRLSRRLSNMGSGRANIEQLVLVMEADVLGRGSTNSLRFQRGQTLLERARAMGINKEEPKRILRGGDLIKDLGWIPGAKFGFVLDNVYEAQLEGRISNYEEAIELAEAIDPDNFLPENYSDFKELFGQGLKSEIRHTQLEALASGYNLSLPHKSKAQGGKSWKQIVCMKKQLQERDINFILSK